MSESNRTPRVSKPKRVRFFNGLLSCIRCRQQWRANDLNEERKVVKCPVCAAPNDVKEARKRAGE